MELGLRHRSGQLSASPLTRSEQLLKSIRVYYMAAFVAALGTMPSVAEAQDRFPGCDSPQAHQFDFWAGAWNVESRTLQQDGTWLETDQEWRAEEVVGGCVFIDFADGNFSGQRMRGMGTRYWVPGEEKWIITWTSTDNPGGWGEWRGSFDADGNADFFQETETPNGIVTSRIRWEDITDNSAHWEYGISRDDGATWTTFWTMEFLKTR
jgi:hypothetical protein